MKAEVSATKWAHAEPSLVFTEDSVSAEHLAEIDSLAAKAIANCGLPRLRVEC